MSEPQPESDLPLVSREQLAEALARLGLPHGGTIFVHSSLKSLGRMDDGPEGAIEAMRLAVGPEGHVAVPTHSYTYVNERNPGEPYDPALTRSRTGAITEALRRRPGAFRSGHPTHSVAAIGPKAELLVSGHRPDGGTFNIAGPHARYTRWNATIVFLGVELASNTTYHAVEEWLGLPYMPLGPVMVAQPGGPPRVVMINRPNGHRNFYRNIDKPVTNLVTDELVRRGLVAQTHLNHTKLLAVRARDVVRVTVEMELVQPGALLCDDFSCAFCQLARHHCVEQRQAIATRARALLARRELCDSAAPADTSW